MSWEQLIAIAQEARERQSEEVIESCPNDGEPLKEGPNGELYCPFDGWRPSAGV
jgi:hypothetical protein